VSPTPHIESEQIQTGKRDRTAVVVMPIGIGHEIDTRLVFTEQGAFFGGDDSTMFVQHMRNVLESMVAELARAQV
jgi:hypothetical protein